MPAAYLIQWDESVPEERLHDNCKILTLHVLLPVGELGDAILGMGRLFNPAGKAKHTGSTPAALGWL
jgi:hypothetical protein